MLSSLDLLLFMGLIGGRVTTGAHDETSQTDLAVDFLLALEVGLCGTLASEDDVLARQSIH